jgi:hypothetical protein
MVPEPSTTMGWRKPNSLIEAATLSTAVELRVRAFRAYGIGFEVGQVSISIEPRCKSAKHAE